MASLVAQLILKNMPATAEAACRGADTGLIPGLGRTPGERNDNPLQYICLGNPMDTGAWWAIAHGVAKSRTRLSTY